MFTGLALIFLLQLAAIDTQRDMIHHIEHVELTADITADIVGELVTPPDRTLIELVHCHEDEAWAPVDHNTPGALVDSRGVTRACVHLDNLYVDGSP
jgi:hypothetical protein